MLMYTCIHGVYMWEVEPTLYWRVKKKGKWTWVRAQYEILNLGFHHYHVKPPEVDESE